MSSRRFLWILAAALLAALGALYVAKPRHGALNGVAGPLLPSLASDLGAVDGLTIRKGSATPRVSLHKQGERWMVAERGDYPADVPKLRKLLLDLRGAAVIEEKTSNPANYRILGVEDAFQPDAAGTEVTIDMADKRQAIIVGKPSGGGVFVRRVGEAGSLLVEPGIAVATQPRDWIDVRIADIPPDLIQRIDLKPAAGPSYSLHRKAPGGADFALDMVPAGRAPVEAVLLAPPAGAFGSLAAEDVAPSADVDFKTASVAVLTLTGGNQVTLTGAAVDGKHWLMLSPANDAALSAKTSGRAYEISSFRYDAIFRPLERLLKPKP